MSEINHFKVFVLCSGDVAADMDYLHVKRIHLVGSSYIVIWDNLGESLDVLRSHTTLFASAFQALIPPLDVPSSSYGQEKWVTKQNLKLLNMVLVHQIRKDRNKVAIIEYKPICRICIPKKVH
jgi:hypothetical protein